MKSATRVKTLPLKRFLLALCLLSAFNLIACSGLSKNNNKNTISPYDPEFDPDVDDSAKNEKILNADEQIPLLLEALELYDDELYSSAKETLATLQRQFPSSYYAPLVELKLADSNYFLGEYSAAIESYEEFLRLRPRHEAAAYARLQIANCHFAQYRGVVFDQTPLTQAEAEYKKVIAEFPLSSAAAQASSSLKRCEQLRQEHAAYVARFYHKRGLEDASINRAKKLLSDVSLEDSREVLGGELFKNVQDSISDEELTQLQHKRKNKQSKPSSNYAQLGDRSPGSLAISKRSLAPTGSRAFLKDELSQDGSRPLLYVCYKQENSTLMEIQLPKNLQPQEPKAGTRGEWKFFLDIGERANKSEHNFELVLANKNLGCEQYNLRAKLLNTTDNRLALFLSSSTQQEAKALTVDRPNRLLILLK